MGMGNLTWSISMILIGFQDGNVGNAEETQKSWL